MRKYWLYFRLSLIRTFTYRGQLVIYTLASLLSVVPLMAIWLIYGGGSVGGYTRTELIVYYLVGLFMQRIIYSSLINYYVQEIISDGTVVGLFLTKPVSFFWAAFGLSTGWMIVAVVIGAIITALFGATIGQGLAINLTFSIVIAFSLAALLAMVVTYAFSLVIGLVSFWTVNTSSLVSLFWIALLLLGGITLPLTFFPPAFQIALSYNPFRFMFSFPLEILMGKVSLQQMFTGFSTGLAWIVFFVFAYKVLWKNGNKVYVGYGQ